MLSYRCYFLDGADRIASFVELNPVSDEDAINQAKRYGHQRRMPIEVWRASEMIYSDSAIG